MVTKFLIFSSGASLGILTKCPRFEVNKYASIGMTIVFTSILSMISSYFAFKLIFNAQNIAIIAAILWGSIIFNLDRYIISSMRSSDNKLTGFVKSIPRLLIAVLIAIIVSKPLEIQLFKSEINTFLNNIKTSQLFEVKQKNAPDLKLIESKEQKLKTNFESKLLLRDKYYEDYKCECTGLCGTKKKGYGPECRSRKKRYELFLSELNIERAAKDSILKKYNLEKSKIKARIDKEETFILTNEFGLFDHIKALNQIDKFSSFFIFFIFVMIETAPILTKLLSEKGPYDNLILEFEMEFEASYLEKKDEYMQERIKNKKLKEMTNSVEIKSKQSELNSILKQEALERYEKMRQALDNENLN